VPELFFETAARGGQIRCVHQCHRVGLHALPLQQPPHQILIDAPQSAHPNSLTKLMQHPGGGQRVPQPGETPPRRLFRQLHRDQIERMRGRQHGQQMGAPQLRRTQIMTPTTGESARANLGDEIIGCVRTHQFEQAVGANGRQSQTHA
jgi:hypothetical protein